MMRTLEKIVALASSGTVSLIIVILGISFLAWFSYLCYRAGRDFEVFLLERQRLRDELILREEEEDQ